MPRERRAAIYARVSTEEQAKVQVTSTETQIARCREKAASLNIPVAPDDSGLIIEEQHSGADLRWEGTKFMALVRRAEAGDFSDLIVLDIDRFCRGGSATYGAQRGYFSEAGVTIHYVLTDFGSESNPFAGGMAALLADAAQWQRDKIREASMRTRTAIAAEGYLTPGPVPPFGFRWVEDATQRTKRGLPRKVGLEPDPVTAPALLHITEHVANGGSIEEARRWLMERQLPTPRGYPTWHGVTIRRILHNPTNYGQRRSFRTRVVQREEGARRPASLKTRSRQISRPEEEQFLVKREYVTAIPGLTYDLWRRAVEQLKENQAFSLRNTKLPLEERVQHGLLRGPMIRCAVCGHTMTLLHNRVARARQDTSNAHADMATERWFWRYECHHFSTPNQGIGMTSISASKLDTLVWDTAASCLRDPAFFTRLLEESDAVSGPAVRLASLTRQLAEAANARDKLLRQLERLDADDDLVAEYQAKLRANKTLRDELAREREATQQVADAEEARRATISSFTRYADSERDKLESYSALQRHDLLRALRTRVTIGRGATLSRVTLTFDLRHLPAHEANAAFSWPGVLDVDVYERFDDALPSDPQMQIDLSETPSVAIVAADAQGPLEGAVTDGMAERVASATVRDATVADDDVITEQLYSRWSGRCSRRQPRRRR